MPKESLFHIECHMQGRRGRRGTVITQLCNKYASFRAKERIRDIYNMILALRDSGASWRNGTSMCWQVNDDCTRALSDKVIRVNFN